MIATPKAATAPDPSGTVLEAKSHGLARKYAEALLGAAQAAGEVEGTLADLDALIEHVWRARPEFARLLASPSHSPQDKDRILTETFEGRLDGTLLRFLRVLNRHGRMEFLDAIAAQARSQWEFRQHRRRVRVRSAVPLDDGQLAALRDRLSQMMQMTPIITAEVDPSILGGLVIQVGDYVYDSSVRNRYLAALRRQLVEEKVHQFRAQRDRITSESV